MLTSSIFGVSLRIRIDCQALCVRTLGRVGREELKVQALEEEEAEARDGRKGIASLER